ncbi:MAG: hypothetical protein ACK4N5_27090, partial [Myxococcales bacterium]
MYPILLLGLATLPAGVLLGGRALGDRTGRAAMTAALALASLGLAAAGLGAAGRALGLNMVEEAIAYVNPADQARIRLAGQAEARVCLI